MTGRTSRPFAIVPHGGHVWVIEPLLGEIHGAVISWIVIQGIEFRKAAGNTIAKLCLMSVFRCCCFFLTLFGVSLDFRQAYAQIASPNAPQFASMTVVTNFPTFLETDLTIDRSGWFILRDPESGKEFVTRYGAFTTDANGLLVNEQGLRLQGYRDELLSQHGDLMANSIDPFFPGYPLMKPVEITSDGRLWTKDIFGAQSVIGQILLHHFASPANLTRVAPKLYSVTATAQPVQEWAVPGTNGLGTILVGVLDATPEEVRITMQPNADAAGVLAEGSLLATPVPSDLAIQGLGCFLVRQTNSSELFATRAGLFLVDGEGFLITYDGMRVQGYADGALSSVGDVRIDKSSIPPFFDPGAEINSFYTDGDGQIRIHLTDGSFWLCGKVCRYTFHHPELLVATNLSRYANVAAAGPEMLLLQGSRFGDGIREGSIERVHLTEDLLAARRSFSFFPQGRIERTSNSMDMAITGSGFFMLRNPTNGASAVTRYGAFNLDSSGYVVNPNGLRLQGFCDSSRSVVGDIRINEEGGPTESSTATMAGFSISRDGNICVRLSDSTEFIRGQVLLQQFRAPYLLIASESGCYANITAASPFAFPDAPNTKGSGRVESGALELPSQPENLSALPRDGARLRITREAGQDWAIEATTDFRDWDVIGTIENTSGDAELVDPDSGRYPQRFYRVSVTNP